MKVVEIGIALLLALGGLRSGWRWLRRPLDSTDLGDQLLYAAYRTGRVGLWFAFAGLFALYASIDAPGRAFVDEVQRFRWYVLVPILLAGLQLLTGLALGRRAPDEEPAGRGVEEDLGR